MVRNSANGCPTRGVPMKGRMGRRDMRGGGISERQAGLLEGPQSGWVLQFGCSSGGWGIFAQSHGSCHPSLMLWEGIQKKCTRAEAFLILLGLPLQRPLGSLCFLPEPLLPISPHVFSPSWSTNQCIYEPASEHAYPACMLDECLPDYSPAIIEGWAVAQFFIAWSFLSQNDFSYKGLESGHRDW